MTMKLLNDSFLKTYPPSLSDAWLIEKNGIFCNDRIKGKSENKVLAVDAVKASRGIEV